MNFHLLRILTVSKSNRVSILFLWIVLFIVALISPACNRTPATKSGAPAEADAVLSADAGGQDQPAPNAANDRSRDLLPSEAETPVTDSTPSETEDRLGNPAFSFTTVGVDQGLEFVREDDIRGRRRIIESTGGGVAMLDMDNDGSLDLFFTGGCRVPEELQSETPTCVLFRNLGHANFINTTIPSKLLMPGYCQGCAVGDIDGDGFEDLYVTGFGRNGLWRSNGDGTFENITDAAAVQDSSWSTSCALADFNLDGHLDLYVTNYLDDSPDRPLLCPNENSPDGYEQCPPSKYEGVDDKLFLSNGAGRFIDATESAGLSKRYGKGLGVIVSDLNQDGFAEIFVANDGQANFLFTPLPGSDRSGSLVSKLAYEELALISGCALSGSGYAQASMGIAAGDYDQSGTIDLLLTHFVRDNNTLYSNQGDLQFSDNTRTSGLLGPSKGVLGWGIVLRDFNGDGLPDIFVANGHVEDRRWLQRGEDYRMLPQIFENVGSGRFKEVFGLGDYFARPWLGRGVAAGDLDGDHRVDLAISHQLENSVALLNRSPQVHRTIEVKLVGVQSNRDACNTRVVLEDSAGERLRYDEIIGGGSFQSASTKSVFLSLPTGDEHRLLVEWPSGRRRSITLPENIFNGESGRLIIIESYDSFR